MLWGNRVVDPDKKPQQALDRQRQSHDARSAHRDSSQSTTQCMPRTMAQDHRGCLG